MVTSSVGPIDSSSYYSGGITPASNTGASPGNSLPSRNSLDLRPDTSLQQSITQASSPVAGLADYPANIQQTVQNQEVFTTDTGLAQALAQQAASPGLQSLEASLAILAATGASSAPLEPSLTHLAGWTQVMHEIESPGTLRSNPSLAQNLLQNYTAPRTIPSTGSIVDTNA